MFEYVFKEYVSTFIEAKIYSSKSKVTVVEQLNSQVGHIIVNYKLRKTRINGMGAEWNHNNIKVNILF